MPGDQSSLRGQPSASIRCSSAVRKPGSTQRLAGARVARVDRQPLDQSLARGRGRALELAQVRPWRFRIDVIGRHRRDAAPVVDAGRR